MFIVRYSIPFCISYAINYWAFLLFYLSEVKWNGYSLSLSFMARLGRLDIIEPRNPLSKWKRVFNTYVENDNNQLPGLDFFTPAYLLPKSWLLKGQSMAGWMSEINVGLELCSRHKVWKSTKRHKIISCVQEWLFLKEKLYYL